MNRPLYVLIVMILLSSVVLAVPVSYKVRLSETGMYTVEAVSDIGTTEATTNGNFILLNHLSAKDDIVDFFVNGIVLRRISQPLPGSAVDVNIIVNGSDKNKDGIVDENDANPPNNLGLLGDETYITTNLRKISMQRSPMNVTNISSDGNVIVEFDYGNLTVNMSAVSIFKQNSSSLGSLIISGLSHVGTKTVYVDRVDTTKSTLCVKDADITSINQITALCTAIDEHALICDGVEKDGYTCSIVDAGTRYKISGLTHSAVQEQTICGDNIIQTGEQCDGSNFGGATCQSYGYDTGSLRCSSTCTISTSGCFDTPSSTTNVRSSGGGSHSVCIPSWSCTEWKACQENGIQTCLSWVDANNCGIAYAGGSFRNCVYTNKTTTNRVETKGNIDVPTATTIDNTISEKTTKTNSRGNLLTSNVIRTVVGDTLNFMRGHKIAVASTVFLSAALTATLLFTFTRGGRRNFRKIQRRLDKYYDEFK